MKKTKGLKTAHTANSKIGMGDYYGSGIRQPIGKMRDGAGLYPISKKGMKKPPKSLA